MEVNKIESLIEDLSELYRMLMQSLEACFFSIQSRAVDTSCLHGWRYCPVLPSQTRKTQLKLAIANAHNKLLSSVCLVGMCAYSRILTE